MKRWLPGLVAGCLLAGACGGDPPLLHTVEAAAEVDADEADDVAVSTTLRLGAVLDAAAVSTPTTTAAGAAEARVLRGTADLLAGFFGALQTGDFERASRYTAGPARNFLQSLTRSATCGMTVVAATTTPPGKATVGSKGEFRLDAASSLTFSTNVTQRFEQVAVREEKDGSWRIYDLVVGGASVEGFVASPLPVELEFDRLRMLRVEACFGTNRITGSVDLVSGSDFRTEFLDAFVRFPSGEVLRPATGLGELAEPIPPQGRRRWNFDFAHAQTGTIATIVLVTKDTEGKSLGMPRERLYPVKMPPLFADTIAR